MHTDHTAAEFPSRRSFIRTTVAVGAGLAGSGAVGGLAVRALAQPAKAARPLKLLVLGGTRFLGPAIVDAAKARGHTITLFNRGKSRPGIYPELEHLLGDRDPKVGDGLKALEGRQWDAVIDTSAYYPRIARASAELLEPNTGTYIFVSSVSAYANHDTVNDESQPVGTIPDPTVETMGDQFQNYGPLKALCEQAVSEVYGADRACNVRPGYIVGPFDGSDRFTYWPLRVRKGGTIAVAGSPSDPVQVIDVRDLGEWLVRLAENKTAGLFNAVGPKGKLEVGAMLHACKSVTGADARFVYLPGEFCQKHEFSTPIVIPQIEGYRGFHVVPNVRAIKAGLTFRPIADTVRDTLAWFDTLPEERREQLRAGVDPAKEAAVLEAWAAERAG